MIATSVATGFERLAVAPPPPCARSAGAASALAMASLATGCAVEASLAGSDGAQCQARGVLLLESGDEVVIAVPEEIGDLLGIRSVPLTIDDVVWKYAVLKTAKTHVRRSEERPDLPNVSAMLRQHLLEGGEPPAVESDAYESASSGRRAAPTGSRSRVLAARDSMAFASGSAVHAILTDKDGEQCEVTGVLIMEESGRAIVAVDGTTGESLGLVARTVSDMQGCLLQTPLKHLRRSAKRPALPPVKALLRSYMSADAEVPSVESDAYDTAGSGEVRAGARRTSTRPDWVRLAGAAAAGADDVDAEDDVGAQAEDEFMKPGREALRQCYCPRVRGPAARSHPFGSMYGVGLAPAPGLSRAGPAGSAPSWVAPTSAAPPHAPRASGPEWAPHAPPPDLSNLMAGVGSSNGEQRYKGPGVGGAGPMQIAQTMFMQNLMRSHSEDVEAGAGRALRRLHALQARVCEQPGAVVADYIEHLMMEMNLEAGDHWTLADYTALIAWGKMHGLQRVHFHLFRLITLLLKLETAQEAPPQ